MKIKFDIDCTPEEIRAALGLPDVKPMQEVLVAELEGRLKAALASIDPETMIKTWMPAGIQEFEQMQKAFWSHLGGTKDGTNKED